MGNGSTLCEAGPPRVRWTCGAFRRMGENHNKSLISTPILRSRTDQREDGSVRSPQQGRGWPMVVGVRSKNTNYGPREFGFGTVQRTRGYNGWPASCGKRRESSGQLVERSDHQSPCRRTGCQTFSITHDALPSSTVRGRNSILFVFARRG